MPTTTRSKPERRFSRFSTNQKMNAYLKEIADLCGLNKKLTTHAARHTFATTVTLSNHVSMESVSKMLGHTSINMTRKYARIADKLISEDMQKLEGKYNFDKARRMGRMI